VKLRQQLQSIENDPSLDKSEKAHQKEALILQHTERFMVAGGLLGVGGSRPLYSPVGQNFGLTLPTTMSPHAPAFYPPGNTVESVVGKASFFSFHYCSCKYSQCVLDVNLFGFNVCILRVV
jgi:hypothetical protein